MKPVQSLTFVAALVGLPALALDSSVDLAIGARSFNEAAIPPFQPPDEDYQTSVFVSGEVEVAWSGDKFVVESQVFSSWDRQDADRRYTNVKQAVLRYSGGGLSVSAGMDTFYWGVSETVNLLNTLNQSDLRASIDGKSKMGQAHLALTYSRGAQVFRGLYLPDFVELEFPARPAAKLPIRETMAQCAEGACDGAGALRWELGLAAGDLAFSYFDGTRRDPLWMPASGDTQALVPLYVSTRYLAFDGVYFVADAMLKLEYKYGEEQQRDYYAYNLGFEYPLYPASRFVNSANLVLEFLKDNRGQSAETIGQNDVFFGGRFMLGDLNQAFVRAVMGLDLDYDSRYLDVSVEYRLTDYVRFEGSVIQFANVDPEDQRLFLIENESFIEAAVHVAF